MLLSKAEFLNELARGKKIYAAEFDDYIACYQMVGDEIIDLENKIGFTKEDFEDGGIYGTTVSEVMEEMEKQRVRELI